MKKTILVTGGAGYIGSHMVRMLLEKGYAPVVLDNLSTGHRELIPSGVPLIKTDIRDEKAVEKAFLRYRFLAVAHFAGLISVGESVTNPFLYYDNNVNGSFVLINSAVRHKVKAFIFSSTAAVYASTASKKIKETSSLGPQNPYGWSKLFVERMLEDAGKAHGLKSMRLRYFNACGARAGGQLGEWHDPETHLIPNILRSFLSRKRLTVFGKDHPTPDGTCVRDYIHVEDLCEGHWIAIEKLLQGHPGGAFNLGTGRGVSVMDVINAVEQETGRKVIFSYGHRREGDASFLVADSSLAQKELGWRVRFSLSDAVASAWAWEQKRFSRGSS